ncbi:MAG: hypothetical protein DMF63_14435 [Acidobacteria bacterium]|nr:MAG: hypothetical protein DMF63_14435 [Acidobacteriota bacterium]
MNRRIIRLFSQLKYELSKNATRASHVFAIPLAQSLESISARPTKTYPKETKYPFQINGIEE